MVLGVPISLMTVNVAGTDKSMYLAQPMGLGAGWTFICERKLYSNAYSYMYVVRSAG